MREFSLDDGEIVEMSSHLEDMIHERRLDLQEIKETIQKPEIVLPNKDYANGKIYRKSFGEYSVVVCTNEDPGKPRFALTAWNWRKDDEKKSEK